MTKLSEDLTRMMKVSTGSETLQVPEKPESAGLRAALKIVEAERERHVELSNLTAFFAEKKQEEKIAAACDRIATQLRAELEK